MRNLFKIVYHSKHLCKLVLLGLMVTLPFYLFVLRLDFRVFNFQMPDLLYFIHWYFWVPFVVLAVLLVILRKIGPEIFAKTLLIIFTLILVVFPICQYPQIISWDHYSHAMETEWLAAGLKIGDIEIAHGYLQYPGAHILLNIVETLIPIGLLEVGLILAIILRVLTILLLSKIGNMMLGQGKGYWVALLFIVGNFTFIGSVDYGPRMLGLVLFFFCLYSSIKSESVLSEDSGRSVSRVWLILFLLSAFALVITHPISSLFLIATMIGIYVVQRFTRQTRIYVNIFSILAVSALWLSWQNFLAVGYSDSFLKIIGTNLSKGLFLFQSASSTITTGVVENPFLVTYRKVIHISAIFMAAGSLLFAFKKQATKFFFGVLIGTFLLTLLFFFLADSANTWLDRAILFGYIPVASLAVLFYYSIRENHSSRFKRVIRPVNLVAYAYVALFSLSFFATYQQTYSITIHPWETNSVVFLVNHNTQHKTVIVDDITAVIYEYFDLNASTDTINRFKDPFSLLNETTLKKGEIVMRSFRQEVDWYCVQGTPPDRWKELDSKFILSKPEYTRFFDSNYVQLYLQRVRAP